MIRVCGWCRKILGHKGSDDGETTGICEECAERLREEDQLERAGSHE